MLKRMMALLCCLLLLAPAAGAEGIPQLLQFTQKATEREYVRKDVYV